MGGAQDGDASKRTGEALPQTSHGKKQKTEHHAAAPAPCPSSGHASPASPAAAAAADGDSRGREGGRGQQPAVYKDTQSSVRFTDRTPVKEERRCHSEAAALEETIGGALRSSAPPAAPTRRLGDFSVADEAGSAEPLECIVYSKRPLFISGVVYPRHGHADKDTGRRLERFGPLRSFSLDLAGKEAGVVVTTAAASYTLIRPSTAYRKHFEHLAGQAALTMEVHRVLSPAHGGTTAATLEEVVARLARTKVVKGYSTAREGLLVNGKFVLTHLAATGTTGAPAPRREAAGFAAALEAAVQESRCEGAPRGGGGNPEETDTAHDGRAADRGKAPATDGGQMDADEQFARQLQAKIDNERHGGAPKASATPYLKVSEEEIADDYPAPAAYSKEENEDEVDELLFFSEDAAPGGGGDPELLPRHLLADFSLYNAEGLLATLELLPMQPYEGHDVELYASGVVGDEDDGAFWGGDGASGSGAAPSATSAAGPRLFLCEIREWTIEYGADCLFISIRTDVAWYRLGAPAARYAPWYGVVLKTARLAARVLGMLSGETRASKLSLGDVIKRVAALPPADPCHVSKKPDVVERFVVVHSQIVLSCFHNYPIKAVRESAFASALRARLVTVRHCKLYRPAPASARGPNRNPTQAGGRRGEPMQPTTTRLVAEIWQRHGGDVLWAQGDQAERGAEGGRGAPPPPPAAAAAAAGGPRQDGSGAAGGETSIAAQRAQVTQSTEEEPMEETTAGSGGRPTDAAPLARDRAPRQRRQTGAPPGQGGGRPQWAPPTATAAARLAHKWLGEPELAEDGRKVYMQATLGDWAFGPGDAVVLSAATGRRGGTGAAATSAAAAQPALGLLQAMWQDAKSERLVQVWPLLRGADTVLGAAASDSELFLAARPTTRPLDEVQAPLAARHLERAWDASARGAHLEEDRAPRAANAAAAATGAPLALFWRRQYVPEEGMFRDPPKDLRPGTRLPEDEAGPGRGAELLAGGAGFVKDGATYKLGDFMFTLPDVFAAMPGAFAQPWLPAHVYGASGHKGSLEGVRAWGVARLVAVGGARGARRLIVERYWRPEDISRAQAYTAATYYDVYAGSQRVEIELDDVVGPLEVGPAGGPASTTQFACVGSYCPKTRAFGAPPEDMLPRAPGARRGTAPIAQRAPILAPPAAPLAALDIFAGCGGLSEGFQQAGVASTKWAIEYEKPAAEAFKINHPAAEVFQADSNALLHAAMAKAGAGGDCVACPEAAQAAAELPPTVIAALPAPGEVDLLCGGPPCQGYSGMNRFAEGEWSLAQNAMVMAFLSYADFYRPRYVLLENVRTFATHGGGASFRLAMRCLLDMGYQLRFGVLNAGNFGVPQARARFFMWAAAPGERLPDWPAPEHAFRATQLGVAIPGGATYFAARQIGGGAPLRPLTVRDAIADLPPILNGHDAAVMCYPGSPQSAFQVAARRGSGSSGNINDHVCRRMNELNMERCRSIHRNCSGADWRVLQEVARLDPARATFKGQPLVPAGPAGSAAEHNGWRGVYGRLDAAGHFPTITTDPQPSHKVGQVFHPSQDRIVSVRECARAQGFPDRFRFAGQLGDRHRQVGNAVPPPLAAALGRALLQAAAAAGEPAPGQAAPGGPP